jgi:hypothetical protein
MDQNTEAVAFERFTNLANLFFGLLMSGFVLSLIVFAMRARTKEIGGAPLLWRLFALGFLALWLYGAVTRGLGLFSVRRFVLHPDRMLVSFRKRIEEADYGNTTLCLTPNAHSLNYGSGERTLPLVEFSDSRLTSELRKRLPREEWCQVWRMVPGMRFMRILDPTRKLETKLGVPPATNSLFHQTEHPHDAHTWYR